MPTSLANGPMGQWAKLRDCGAGIQKSQLRLIAMVLVLSARPVSSAVIHPYGPKFGVEVLKTLFVASNIHNIVYIIVYTVYIYMCIKMAEKKSITPRSRSKAVRL